MCDECVEVGNDVYHYMTLEDAELFDEAVIACIKSGDFESYTDGVKVIVNYDSFMDYYLAGSVYAVFNEFDDRYMFIYDRGDCWQRVWLYDSETKTGSLI